MDRATVAKSLETHVVSVSSGKGGVGKSNLVLNVGLALAQRGRKVLLMDADMGLANIDILIGVATRENLSHVLRNERSLEDVIVEGPGGVHLLPAASGVEWMANLTTEQKLDFVQKMGALSGLYDILLIDTGAGISSNVTYFNLAAQTRVVLVTPEPTSLTDAYALIKVLHTNYRQRDFEIVVNTVRSDAEARAVYRNLTTVADRFLDVRLGFLGCVYADDHLSRSVLRQKPVLAEFPDASVSKCYRALAQRLEQIERRHGETGDIGLFWKRVLETTTG